MDALDPAHSQEGAPEDASKATVPPVEEDAAESLEESGEGEGAPHKDQEEPSSQVEIVVDGEEPTPKKDAAPQWVKDLRKKNRELEAELERVRRTQGQPDQAADPGPKPTLEDCDFDSAAFEKRLESWHDARKRKEAADAQASQQAEAQHRAWQSRLDVYGRGKEELSKQIPDFAEAEAAVQSMLDVTQQGVILHGAENPALVVCALGQNPKLAQDLANTKDPIQFAFKVAKLEARLKTQKKTQAPPPEKPINGSGSKSGTADSQLERLRAEAERTGDHSKVIAYKRQKRTAA